MTQYIPLSILKHYPAFLSENSGGDGVLFSESPALLRALRPLDRFTPEHRTALCDALKDDLRSWDAPPQALAAAALLGDSHTYAVVTGQQAGIAGGPLYTTLKAVGAVRAAAELAAQFPDRRFVPVFWIEADDHDFDEARRLSVMDAAGIPHSLSYDDGESRPVPVGDREVSHEAVMRLAEELRTILPPTEFTDAALDMLTGSYASGTLADGFARMLYAVLGDTPLVLLNSRNPALKQLAADLFAREAADPLPLFVALSDRTDALRAAGLPVPITPKAGALFIIDDGERRSLDPVEGGYEIRGTNRSLTVQEAAALAREHPDRFSPNVALRPIVQDAVLPTAIYLGGPSEVAYLNQLRDVYAVFGIAPPAVAARPFALLLEPKVRRILEQRGISIETLLSPDFQAASLVLDALVVGELEDASERAFAGVGSAFGEMESVTGKIDPTLIRALGASAASAEKTLRDFSKKLLSALKRREQAEIGKIESARGLVLPGGALQERTVCALYFIARYGPERFREMLGQIVPSPGQLQVVEI